MNASPPSRERSSAATRHSSTDAPPRWTIAPSPRAASVLAIGASAGTNTSQRTPIVRAAAATACAWLPAEAATTPPLQPCSPSAASFAAAPRTLNEPVLWRFSAFSATRPPARSEIVRRGEHRGPARGALDGRPRGFDVTPGDRRGLDGGHVVRLSPGIPPAWSSSPSRPTPPSPRARAGTHASSACCGSTSTARRCTASIPPPARTKPRRCPPRSARAAPTADPGPRAGRARRPARDRRRAQRRARAAPRPPPRPPRACAPTTARSTPPGASGSGRWPTTSRRARARSTASTGGELTTVIEPVDLSNGLDWRGERMYFADTPTQRVDLLDYDEATGEVENRRTFVTIDEADGIPDGLVLDDEGGMWLALWGGGAGPALLARGRARGDTSRSPPTTSPPAGSPATACSSPPPPRPSRWAAACSSPSQACSGPPARAYAGR